MPRPRKTIFGSPSPRAVEAAFLFAMLAACGDTAAETEASGNASDTSSDESTTGVTTTSAETGSTGGNEHSCVISPGDHASATCSNGVCPFETDVEVECSDTEFSDPGIRVAVTSESAFLFTAGTNTAIVLEAQGSRGIVSDLPPALVRTTMLLAQDQAGTIALAADTTMGGSYVGGLAFFRPDGDAWLEESVFDLPDRYVRTYDLELARDGTAHLWFEDDPPESFEHATRRGPNDFLTEDTIPGHPGSWTRWTLDRDDVPVGFSFAGDIDAWQLETRIDGLDTAIGSPVREAFPNTYRPLSPAVAAAAASIPGFSVVVQYAEGLRLAWPSDAGPDPYQEVEAPGTALATFACAPGDPYVDCGPDCHEQVDGLDDGGFAATQTEDGRVWLAWVEEHYDFVHRYTESCGQPPNTECYCAIEVSSDDSTATLHVARLDFGEGAFVDVLELPIAALQTLNLFGGPPDNARLVDLRAFGNRLAIGLRLRGRDDTDPLSRIVRLLEIDASTL